MTIEKRLSPEEEELLVKQADLEDLAEQLSHKELDLRTLFAGIDSFFRVYNAALESKVVEAKRLRARIARAIFVLHPTESTKAESQEARESAQEARKDQQERTEAPGDSLSTDNPTLIASPDLRSLYRKLVLQSHPDLAHDEDDKLLRNEFMVRVNLAYEQGDESTLQALTDEWIAQAGPLKSESIGDRLVRVIRQIADVRSRLIVVDAEIEEVKNSDDYLLVVQSEEAISSGRDLIAEHVAKMDEHVAELRSNIDGIRDQLVAL